MNDPCRLELRGLSGSEPCGACNRPARDHRGHREYVEPTDPEDGITAFAWSCLADGCCPNTCTTCHPVEPEYWTVEYMIGNSDWISHGLGVYTTRAGAEEALKLCSIHVDSKRVARCDASSRIVSSSVAAVETFEPAKHSEPDSTTVTMSQDAYDAAIAGAKREGWSRAVLKLRDGHRFVQASDCLARTIPDAWPTPPNPLTKIASALSCDAGESECLDAIDSLRRELSAAEDASSMERQRRKDAEQERDDRPAITRKQARAWLDLANTIPATGSVEYLAALTLAKFADGLRTIDSETRVKIDASGYQRGVEEAATAALTTARHCQISSFVDGRTYELLDRDEVVRAIRALATRGGV